MRFVFVLLGLVLFGAAKLPVERAISDAHRRLHFRTADLGPGLREQIGQLGFIAGLSGFRSLVADVLFIQAHVAWERTEWERVLLLFRQVTALQPRSVLFWDTAAWHMAWNASAAALRDSSEPRVTLRIKAQRHYLELGKDFLERGIQNNPERPELYEALARLYRDKYHDHKNAAEFFGKAADLPGARKYTKRFSAYELSYCDGLEQKAYDQLHALYALGEKERVPTLIRRLQEMELKLDIPPDQRIPNSIP